VNTPLADIAEGYPAGLPEDRATPVVTICKVGERSLLAMLLLKSLGYRAVTSVRGGTEAWSAAGLPTDPGT
jgi:rhodanese-related sulfurtransferase